LQSNNLTIDQAELWLCQGMSASEFAKLKERLAMQATKKYGNKGK
jgi:hypothetical protein